jgi:hypothetical protein
MADDADRAAAAKAKAVEERARRAESMERRKLEADIILKAAEKAQAAFEKMSDEEILAEKAHREAAQFPIEPILAGNVGDLPSEIAREQLASCVKELKGLVERGLRQFNDTEGIFFLDEDRCIWRGRGNPWPMEISQEIMDCISSKPTAPHSRAEILGHIEEFRTELLLTE